MKDWRKLGKKLLFPPIWMILILTVISTIMLVFVFTEELDGHPISYVSYVLSFYTLSIVTVFFIRVFPQKYKAVRQKVYENKYGNRYLTDVVFKTQISLYLSLGINRLYIVDNM